MIPREFRPFHAFPADMDDQARADWMLALLDEHADRRHTVLIANPVAENGDVLDSLEDDFRRAYDLARESGRTLGVKFLHGVDTGRRTPGASRVVVMLHEHKWIGGQCVNGCPDIRRGDS